MAHISVHNWLLLKGCSGKKALFSRLRHVICHLPMCEVDECEALWFLDTPHKEFLTTAKWLRLPATEEKKGKKEQKNERTGAQACLFLFQSSTVYTCNHEMATSILYCICGF